jgi:pimeloyl-ACP methyl ester carboxylesterase
MYELMTTDLRPELGRIKAPVSVIYAYDMAYGVPAEAIDRLYRDAYANAPGAGFQRIDDSFHFIMIDQPEAFARAIDQFLAQ